MQLKQKGASAQIGAFKQLKVSLIWTSAVDLDLMAFYKTKTGQTGGVYSNNYAGGSLGDLNNFPFMQLSGDEGVGATGGDNREEMRIFNLDQIEELYVCALNFTDASQGNNKVFADYDARVEVMTDQGDTHTVSLDSSTTGTVAVLCKIKSGFLGAELINDSSVMVFDQFQSIVSGASSLKLSSKVTLKQKGDSHVLKSKGMGEIVINLNWTQNPDKKGFFKKLLSSSIDLDLGCFYELRNGDKSVIDGLQFNNNPALKGSLSRPPYIYHLGDDRTGGTAEGEFIKINIANLRELRRMTIYAFIYEGTPSWKETDAVVTIKVPGQPTVEVKMGSQTDSRTFCAIAGIEFTPDGKDIKVTKLVSFHNSHGDCDKMYNWGMQWRAGKK